MSWQDLEAEVLGEFCEAQSGMATRIRGIWWQVHSRHVRDKQLAKKRWSLRAMRKRLFGRAVMECGNAKCRVRFVPYRGYTKYCSDRCRKRELALQAYYRRRAALRERTCGVCGVVFTPKWRKDMRYCSAKCRGTVSAANYRQRQRVGCVKACKVCGTAFVPKRRDALYCSKKCLRVPFAATRAAHQREWYRVHRARVLARQSAYRIRNREKVNARQRAGYRRRKAAVA